jgi:phosphate transport system substrate-binding protein
MSSTLIRRLSVAGAAAAALAVASCGESGQQRNGIWAAGSSTVFPFATRVAENFGRNNPEGAPPRVEALGTGGGIQAFCQGLGPRTPDVANASRRMKGSEFDMCVENGVSEIIEIKIDALSSLTNAKIDALSSKIDSKFDSLNDFKTQLLIRMDKS